MRGVGGAMSESIISYLALSRFVAVGVMLSAVVGGEVGHATASEYEFSGKIESVAGREKFEYGPGFEASCRLTETAREGDEAKKSISKSIARIAVAGGEKKKSLVVTVTTADGPVSVTMVLGPDGALGDFSIDTGGKELSATEKQVVSDLTQALFSLGPIEKQNYRQDEGLTDFQLQRVSEYFDKVVEKSLIQPITAELKKSNPAASVYYVRSPLDSDFRLVGTTMVDSEKHLVFQGTISVTYYLNGKPLRIFSEGYQLLHAGSGLVRAANQMVSITALKTSIRDTDKPILWWERKTSCDILKNGDWSWRMKSPADDTSPPPSANPSPGVKERLEVVNDLLRKGLITEQEAAEKRREILRAL